MIHIDDFMLTSDVTVGQLKQWMNKKDQDSKNKMIELIHHFLFKRYLQHLPNADSGFLKMAVSCLLIEAIELFRRGEDKSKSSKSSFEAFFIREQNFFPNFETIDFYTYIRCGILHQADIVNGWRIVLDGDLLDKNARIISANKFVVALTASLDNYLKELNAENLNSDLWQNALKKLAIVCRNCQVNNYN